MNALTFLCAPCALPVRARTQTGPSRPILLNFCRQRTQRAHRTSSAQPGRHFTGGNRGNGEGNKQAKTSSVASVTSCSKTQAIGFVDRSFIPFHCPYSLAQSESQAMGKGMGTKEFSEHSLVPIPLSTCALPVRARAQTGPSRPILLNFCRQGTQRTPRKEKQELPTKHAKGHENQTFRFRDFSVFRGQNFFAAHDDFVG